MKERFTTCWLLSRAANVVTSIAHGRATGRIRPSRLSAHLLGRTCSPPLCWLGPICFDQLHPVRTRRRRVERSGPTMAPLWRVSNGRQVASAGYDEEIRQVTQGEACGEARQG